MKVGILTYHNAINYGAVLQAYALSSRINHMGHNCRIIDYRCYGVEIQYSFKCISESTSLLNFFAHNLTCLLRSLKKKRFACFMQKLPLTKDIISNKNDLKNLENEFDIFIVGSDQVFNPICTKNDSTYFLDFVESKTKISYAASLGSIDKFKTWNIDVFSKLNTFKYLTFREDDSTQYIANKLGKKCCTMVDPVWLLDENEWCDVIEDVECANEKYIFVYNLNDYDLLYKYACFIARKTGYKIIAVNRTVMGDYKFIRIANIYSNVSPSQFLGLIKNAQYVITDSFHATSFSLIFGVEFYVILDDKKNNTNSRITLLLDKVGLTERVVTDNSENWLIYDKLDKNVTKQLIKKHITEASKFLGKVLNEE